MKRRVLILSYAFPPSSAVGAFRAARFARFLSAYGWEPLVVAADDAKSRAGGDASRSGLVDESTVVVRARPWSVRDWMPLGLKSPSSGLHTAIAPKSPTVSAPGHNSGARGSIFASLRRAILTPFCTPDRHIWWAIPALLAMRRIVRDYQPDVVLSTSPPHSSHLISLALKSIIGIPVVMDLRDPWAHAEWGEEHHGRIKVYTDRVLERWCVHRAERVILNTYDLLENFRRQYPRSLHAKFISIPNGYDPKVRERVEELVATTPRPGGQPVRLCHAGSVYGRRDIRPLIEAVAILNRRGLRVAFEQVGPLANAGAVADCIRSNQAGQFVQLLGQRPHEEALRRQAVADILVVVRQNTPLQVPAKLYEMMLFGKPLLALDGEGAMTRLVREYDLGVVADPENPVAIAAAIEEVIGRIGEAPSERRAAALVKFDARTQTRELADVLAAAVESRRRSRR